MADSRPRPRSLTDSFGREVERLIGQLPSSPATPTRRVTTTPSLATDAAARRAALRGVWLRTLAALALAVAVADWPYARTCGWMLHGYLAVIGVVLIVGSWACQSAWRTQNASAHVIGLLVVYWGVVLAAEQVLPRIGYAAVDAAWRCAG